MDADRQSRNHMNAFPVAPAEPDRDATLKRRGAFLPDPGGTEPRKVRGDVEVELARVVAQLHWTEKLEVLDFLGWSSAVVSGFAGERLVLGQQRGYPFMEARGSGDTIDDAATNYFWEAMTVGGTRSIPIDEH